MLSTRPHENHNDVRLMYLETAMLVMDTVEAPEGAVEFANAAVQHVENSSTWSGNADKRTKMAGSLVSPVDAVFHSHLAATMLLK